MNSSRAGVWLQQPSGYRAFVPAPLPPDPPLVMDDELWMLLSRADSALGRLDGVTSILPNPDLFVAMFVRQEAVLSSQIEGTQSTLEDVLEFEAGATNNDRPRDVEEVVNYVRAMNHGLARLDEFPLSLPLIKEIHAILMEGTRGSASSPGEFRRSQNWIGAAGATLQTASFVPPPVPEMKDSLHGFEKWLHTDSMPTLLQCGLAHAQFETIHPFLDGNGRVGRLLITFLLCQRQILTRPLLYLSLYLKRHRSEYYDRLSAIRNGDWEGWLKFFLRGVAEVSHSATATARAILDLRERGRLELLRQNSNPTYTTQLFDSLFEQPVVTISSIQTQLSCSYNTAAKLVANLQKPEIALLEQIGADKRNRRYRFAPYLALWENPPGFETVVEDMDQLDERQTTRSMPNLT